MHKTVTVGLVLTLIITACGASGPTSPAGGDSANPLGTGSLSIQGHLTNRDATKDTGIYVFEGMDSPDAQGALDASGNFAITVPVPVAADFYSAETVSTCTPGALLSKNVQVTPSGALIANAILASSADGARQVYYYVNPQGPKLGRTNYEYAAQDVDITGTINCGGSGATATTLNLHLKQGWNLVTVAADTSVIPVPNQYISSFSLPQGGGWYATGSPSSTQSSKSSRTVLGVHGLSREISSP